MTHPVITGPGASHQYREAPQPPVGGGQPPVQAGPTPAWQPMPRKPRNLALPLAIAVTALIALVVGGIVGAALRGTEAGPTPQSGQAPDTPAAPSATGPEASTPSAADVHAQDVAVCTKYAIINSAIPKPDQRAMDILPAVGALQHVLTDNPHASTPVRVAITDVISVWYARLAAYGDVRTRGLAEPPPHIVANEQAAYDQAWATCGLDE